MKTCRILSWAAIFLTSTLLAACRFDRPTPVFIEILATAPSAAASPTHRPPIAAATLASGPTATPTPSVLAATTLPVLEILDFQEAVITISSVARKLSLGPSVEQGAYLVEIVPGKNSPDGAYVVTSILPESNGQEWQDVLTYSAPGISVPIEASARIWRITEWREVGRFMLELSGGKETTFEVSPDALGSGYLFEINPLEPQTAGDRIEAAAILPEFSNSKWHDVLRIQAPAEQSITPIEVVVYAAPSSLSSSAFELKLKANDWPGSGIDISDSPAAYLVGLKPLTPMASRIDRVIVQQEFDGRQWNTVLRGALGANQPTITLRVLVYRVP